MIPLPTSNAPGMCDFCSVYCFFRCNFRSRHRFSRCSPFLPDALEPSCRGNQARDDAETASNEPDDQGKGDKHHLILPSSTKGKQATRPDLSHFYRLLFLLVTAAARGNDRPDGTPYRQSKREQH